MVVATVKMGSQSWEAMYLSAVPICELRTSARVERRVRPGDVKSEFCSTVMDAASRWRVVRDVKLVNEFDKEPAP